MSNSNDAPGSNLPAADPIPMRFGKYVLEQRIAVGGSSEVFLARPAVGVSPAPKLIIKRLRPAVLEDPRSLGTFAMEARLHRAVRHPNVVEVFEAGSIDGEPYLTMEYVDGLDTYRLMRRLQLDFRPLSAELAIFIAYELCGALSCVHSAVDDSGHPLAVVHRDVTPSNIYLSVKGDVKLGDFGIARLLSPNAASPETSPLKGKYSYLSPEQVAGEDFDHRADLFSLAVVLSELLINQSLFPGAGQLAVLLAIRDCRIDNLRENESKLPSGLARVLERALARDPADRFRFAEHFADALKPFLTRNKESLRAELGSTVKHACHENRHTRPSFRGILRPTLEEMELAPTINVRTQGGQLLGPMPLAKIIELTATGRLRPEDEVDLTGNGFRRLADIPELERHVPPSTITTSGLSGPGVPDFLADLSTTSMLEVCARMLLPRETGVLFAERDDPGSARKEIYIAQAKVIHVASSEPNELLGEHLVRAGNLQRSELEIALALLPRYGGRLGDTLIGLNFIDAVQIFRAIRDQGRERVTNIFRWKTGRVSFYRGISPSRVEFALDLDIAPLMLAGVEAAYSDDELVERHQVLLDDVVAAADVPDTLKLVAWPPEVLKVVGAAGEGRCVREIVAALTAARLINIPKALRAIDVACAAGLLIRQPRHR